MKRKTTKAKASDPTSVLPILQAAAQGSGVGLVHLEKFAKDFATAQINAAVSEAMRRMKAMLEEPLADEAISVTTKTGKAESTAVVKKPGKQKKKALGRGMREISRTDQVLSVLRKKGQATLAEICGAIGEDAEQKVYGTSCLSLVKRGLAKRKKVGGVFVYQLTAKAKAA